MDSESTQTLNSMNSPASSSSSAHSNHNVYLSYVGEDTRNNFTDHLYGALIRAGIPTFKHDRQLPIGQNVYSVMRKAIRESRVSVVVFSKGYASSEWCLYELVNIVECKEKWGQLIIPVFYNVDSDDVSKQSGAFADAFARHEECYVDEVVKVEQWRLALREASKLPGWDLQNFANGYEAKFIQEIVRHVLEKTKKELWQSTLEKLRKISPNQIMEKLAISFETLDDDTIKDIFLDIACFFIGMDKDYVIDIFNGCGFFPSVGISILIERCLLKVSGQNMLIMHDLVRDMGRKIVNEKFPFEPEKRSRIWLQKDAINMLRRCKARGSQAIEGLILDLLRPMHLSTKAFEKMHRLRLLQINNVHLDGNFEGLFQELKWLCWHHCPLDCLPDEFHPEKLVFLDMQHTNFNKLWQGTKFLGNLKILNIGESESLTTTPDFTGVPNLEKLSLISCPKLSKVDKTIGFLSKLTSLNLGQCNNLKES
ncbi:hypothetical protein L1987_34982 [Smallanthus sonchifolius]|uniref:Uncharacterized protein n=1 Tax=Smallanthus sonchifolius TaxID=185202 RepID=A0ACB9HWJ4_9ASTR|nr:hypothetical protein L1987_34982 [Smallanthus sonchifolius]